MKQSKYILLITLGLMMLLLLMGATDPVASWSETTRTVQPESMFMPTTTHVRYVGPFTNNTLGLGGSVLIDLATEPTSVSGYINFTDGPDVAGVLCGAANFTGSRNGNNFQFSFTSNDPEPGCSITHGVVYNVSGTISGNEIINGTFTTPEFNQSGVFNAKQTIRSDGRFFNNSLTLDGDVYVDLATWSNTVAGYINFTGDPGDGALCGANSFTGTRSGNGLTFSFLSSDPDPGCDIVDDWRFDLTATLSNNDLTNGTYYVPAASQGGTFYTNGPASDSTAPNGSLTTPTANATVGPGTHTLSATAADNSGGTGVGYVDFSVKYNGAWHSIGTDPTPPYTAQWQTPAGLRSQQIRFAVDVVDKAGNSTPNAGGAVSVNFVESIGSGVDVNWVSATKRAYLNQRSLVPNGDLKCGAASAAMVLAMNGRISNNYSTLSSTANAIYQYPNYIWQVTGSMQDYGLAASYACRTYNDAWAKIKTEIDADRPTIILSSKVTFGHYFVVVGYREEGSSREIIVYDPFGRWRGISGSYTANSTSPSSTVGKWVTYDFDAAFGYSSQYCSGGYLITAQPTRFTPELIVDTTELTPPDPISDEPGIDMEYEGIDANTEATLYLPVVTR